MLDATTAAPATPTAPAAAPDLTALVGPGAVAPAPPAAPTQALPASTVQAPEAPAVNAAPTVMAQIQPFEQNAQNATNTATKLANAGPATAPAPKHARLLNMIQGLAVGLGAFGTAIATHGREGGAPEVQQFEANQQAMKVQQQEAAQQQLSFKVSQQMAIADTNRQTAQNIILLSTLPTDLKLKDLQLTEAQQNVAMGKIAGANAQAEFMNTYGVSPEAFTAMMSGSTAPAPQDMENLRSFSQQKVTAASKILPSDDPYVKQANDVLANPNATPQQIFSAVTGVQRQIGLQKQVTAAQSEQDTARKNSIVGQLSTPEALAAPGSVASIRAAIADPTTNQTDIPRLQALIPQAIIAQNRALQIKGQEKAAEMAVTQGDPNAAGKLLADGTLTLEELKSRGATPQFIASAVGAAKTFDPKFDAPTAAAQARIAGSEANQQFFGATDSLLVKGGTLDQLQTRLNALGNTKFTPYNTYANLVKSATGNSSQAAASAAILGVVDDLAKVIGGGVGTDASRKSALDVINRSLAPGQSQAAIGTIRGVVESQRNGRIGTNRYMKKMFPDPSTLSEIPGVAGTTAGTTAGTPATNDPFAQFGGKAR